MKKILSALALFCATSSVFAAQHEGDVDGCIKSSLLQFTSIADQQYNSKAIQLFFEFSKNKEFMQLILDPNISVEDVEEQYNQLQTNKQLDNSIFNVHSNHIPKIVTLLRDIVSSSENNNVAFYTSRPMQQSFALDLIAAVSNLKNGTNHSPRTFPLMADFSKSGEEDVTQYFDFNPFSQLLEHEMRVTRSLIPFSKGSQVWQSIIQPFPREISYAEALLRHYGVENPQPFLDLMETYLSEGSITEYTFSNEAVNAAVSPYRFNELCRQLQNAEGDHNTIHVKFADALSVTDLVSMQNKAVFGEETTRPSGPDMTPETVRREIIPSQVHILQQLEFVIDFNALQKLSEGSVASKVFTTTNLSEYYKQLNDLVTEHIAIN